MSFLVRNFLRGLVVVVPLAVTVWALWAGFLAIDRLLRLPVPGAGFAVALALVVLVGFLASNFVTRRLLQLVERILDQLPLLKLLHTSLKDLMSAFVGEKRRFNKPVMVDLAADGHVRALGFVTRGSMERFGCPDSVAVYFPQAYNFAGQLVVVPGSAVKPVAIDAAEAMAFIVSGGVTGK